MRTARTARTVLTAGLAGLAGCRYAGSVTVTTSSPGAALGVLANQIIPGLTDGLGTYAGGL